MAQSQRFVLGIETSCDDTSMALFVEDRGVLGVMTAAQLVHGRFGGVVPEIASREHVRTIMAVYDSLLELCGVDQEEIGGIAVSNGPGLIGSLLVGVGFAKSLAYALGIPVVGVHHIESHIMANELDGDPLQCPCVALVVSGGHTQLFFVPSVGRYELAGNTRDDASGEAFDKIAKLLGLGFPGGPGVQKAAEAGDPTAVNFPRAMKGRGGFDFSFSGLKTAVRLHVEGANPASERDVADVAASAQAAIVDVLVLKTMGCVRHCGVGHVYLAGGVAANSQLREQMRTACEEAEVVYHAPLLEYCTDNGAMVARAGAYHLATGRDDGQSLDVFARGTLSSPPLAE
jgi:N6-L-threonylcarbamoyladenine synthase